jgi:hypothetical protein
MNEERLNKVESLKSLLVARATGGSDALDAIVKTGQESSREAEAEKMRNRLKPYFGRI